MKVSRREALKNGLFGVGLLSLRSIATGLPASVLLSPGEALSEPRNPAAKPGRFLVLSLSTSGDPLNANAPGSYESGVAHPPDPLFAAVPIRLAQKRLVAARVWSRFPQKLMDRTVFFHHATGQISHPSLPTLLEVGKDAVSAPVLFAQDLATRLSAVSPLPLLLGADEVLYARGERLPRILPLQFRDLLQTGQTSVTRLEALREDTLSRLSRMRTFQKNKQAFSAQTAQEAKRLGQQLAADLSQIKDDGPTAQVIAAAIAIRLGLSPVVAIRIPFGGDNHFDAGLQQEAKEYRSGVEAVALLWEKLSAYGMADRTCFAHMSVFGRTLKRQGLVGRDHWALHNTALLQGAAFSGGVVGGIVARDGDFAAQAIDGKTGAPHDGADISASESTPALLHTLGTALGVSQPTLLQNLPTAKLCRSCLV
ncbi:MAG TPA: DUF1501 domain-containing protein [Pseudomonadota bacterium]|nr:DUF1501 domain-containing protein [Pseudomonadota bacterium]